MKVIYIYIKYSKCNENRKSCCKVDKLYTTQIELSTTCGLYARSEVNNFNQETPSTLHVRTCLFYVFKIVKQHSQDS